MHSRFVKYFGKTCRAVHLCWSASPHGVCCWLPPSALIPRRVLTGSDTCAKVDVLGAEGSAFELSLCPTIASSEQVLLFVSPKKPLDV